MEEKLIRIIERRAIEIFNIPVCLVTHEENR
jgi:hypothetical protein